MDQFYIKCRIPQLTLSQHFQRKIKRDKFSLRSQIFPNIFLKYSRTWRYLQQSRPGRNMQPGHNIFSAFNYIHPGNEPAENPFREIVEWRYDIIELIEFCIMACQRRRVNKRQYIILNKIFYSVRANITVLNARQLVSRFRTSYNVVKPCWINHLLFLVFCFPE